MKIFLVTQQFVDTPVGGEAVHVTELARELRKRNYDVWVLTLGVGRQAGCENCRLDSDDPLRVPVVRFFASDSDRIRSPYDGSIEANVRRAREFGLQVVGYLRAQPDQERGLVHLHGHYMVPSLAKEIRRDTAFRIVSTIHRAESVYEAMGVLNHPERMELMHEKEMDAINHSDRVVVRSAFVRDYLVELYQDRIRKDHITVIPSAVAQGFMEAPLPSAEAVAWLKTRYGFEGDVVLMFSVFEPLKGFEAALQAWPLLRKRLGRSRPVTLVLAGWLAENHRWYFEKLRKFVARYPGSALRRSVRFLTNVDAGLKRDLYDLADVFLCTPVAEPFGITLAEALARGKVCVATDCEGPRYILDCPDPFPPPFRVCGNGILVANDPGRRSEHVAEALVYALTRKGELAALAESGRRHALRRLSWRNLIDLKTSLYKSVMEETRREACP